MRINKIESATLSALFAVTSLTGSIVHSQQNIPQKAPKELVNNIEMANHFIHPFVGSSKKRQVRQAQTEAKIGVVELLGGNPSSHEKSSTFANSFAGNTHVVEGRRVFILLGDSGAKLRGDLSFIPSTQFRTFRGAQGVDQSAAILNVDIDKHSLDVKYSVERK